MPNRTTYYTDTELDRIEQIAEDEEKSFSAVVREAVQEVYDV